MAICSGSIMEFMNLGFPEMIFIFLLALIIFGPKKLPEIGRQIGKALNEFKRASNEFKAQIESEISHLDVENHQIWFYLSRKMNSLFAIRALSANLPIWTRLCQMRSQPFAYDFVVVNN